MTSPPRPPSSQAGLTLLEVVIALLLFAMMAVFLLSGHARAADAVLRMQVEREMAEAFCACASTSPRSSTRTTRRE